MQDYIQRTWQTRLIQNLKVFPAVVLLGSRQCGKSTMVKNFVKSTPGSLYLDLQNPADANKLSDPALFFLSNNNRIICFDEIHYLPDLYSALRSEIDNNRQKGRFILLGSASQNLIQKTSETLAGRLGIIEMSPFNLAELQIEAGFDLQKYWFRGGYPDSYLATNDQESKLWLENYIRTYVERDVPQLGFFIPALQLRRFITMCAHLHGQLLNASKLAESLGLTHPTIRRYLDILEQTYLVRSVPAFAGNTKKRMVKSPKIYIRDHGLLNQLLGLNSFNDLLGHPVFGSSWEGLVIENCIVNAPEWKYFYYRTSDGYEVDLILERGRERILVECKVSSAPQPSKGFWKVVEDLNPSKAYIIAPIKDSYPLHGNVVVTGLQLFIEELAGK